MPERNIEFGRYGASGIKGHEAVARQLDALASFIATPITAPRGLLARLHYLTRTDHARQAAREAGLTVTDRTLKAWLDGKRSPSRKNLEGIETAYRTVRRHNVARYLLSRLNREGRGTRVEFHPLNQSQVDRPRQRVVSYRTLNVRHWDRIVEAWANDDEAALDDAWISDAVVDLGSEWGQYEYVTNIGFAA
ncbi:MULTISPECIES: transcriptional regulator [unclassified Streptomyces]|uniref:transcriptional regulator n=1 Tax=unclassified Streptomyces TaxID=2593676 RepID=UPI0023659B22|nr:MULTISPECIES: transcriptional regulator [unclassified Streptomyces]MDF3143045.1 transcriptional regulator [Streptomyces sp. T21Q-yed]WDF44445.1 transcriptional regulator [Streptomyces sp. T12]